ncbi:peptidyl-prolyl isomerase [Blattabacterium punctulatus CPU2]|uniref:Peptidyl-prolyl isomerase n=1 Tax=Blattabacterium punctulatus CPU2 TaxID=1457032 RepID=A0AAD1FQT5_9FLAO|nr:peptidylprolyl isomerase [Blattabacterium punctulatus]AWU39529.1 exotoxin [Blattabacterium punctulatus]BBA17543.1 peptidyl-prolyl isomerase [Blattabacterium punctulatus CPU2]
MIKNILFKFNFFLIIFCNFSFAIELEKVNGISVIIGDEIILDSEIKNYLYYNKNISPCKGLKNLLIHKLILYYAKKDPNLQIYDQELEKKVSNILEENFVKTLNKNYYTKEFLEELTETIKNNQYIEKFYQKIIDDIEVSPEEVKYFFNKKKEKLPIIPKKICISYMIFYPKLIEKHRNKIFNFLKKIKNEIHSDKDFSTKAILLSEDYSSALNGGIIKGLKKRNIPKEFERVVYSLKEKQISEPFETNLGFHLVKLEEKKGDEIDIRHILIKPKYTKEELTKTKKFVDLIKNRLINHEIFFETIQDENPINNNQIVVNSYIWKKNCIEEKDLSKKMKKSLIHLKNGEISDTYKEILNGKEVFFIVKLLEKIPSHPISLEKDYTELKNLIKLIKQEEKIKNWVKIQLKKTYLKRICP